MGNVLLPLREKQEKTLSKLAFEHEISLAGLVARIIGKYLDKVLQVTRRAKPGQKPVAVHAKPKPRAKRKKK